MRKIHWQSAVMILLLLCAMPATLRGQDCSALLHQGIYDVQRTVIDDEVVSSFASWFCDRNFGSKADAETFGASIGLPFEGIPVELGFDQSHQTWSQWYSSVCSDVRSNFGQRHKFSQYLTRVNAHLVDAFNRCLETDGLHVWLERHGQLSEFALAAKYRNPGKLPWPTLHEILRSANVECAGVSLPLEITGSTTRKVCTRKDEQEVWLVVNASVDPVGGGTLTLPAVYKAPPPPPPPKPQEWSATTGVFHLVQFKNGVTWGCGTDTLEASDKNAQVEYKMHVQQAARYSVAFEYQADEGGKVTVSVDSSKVGEVTLTPTGRINVEGQPGQRMWAKPTGGFDLEAGKDYVLSLSVSATRAFCVRTVQLIPAA
jgi:hypothetical protein